MVLMVRVLAPARSGRLPSATAPATDSTGIPAGLPESSLVANEGWGSWLGEQKKLTDAFKQRDFQETQVNPAEDGRLGRPTNLHKYLLQARAFPKPSDASHCQPQFPSRGEWEQTCGREGGCVVG